MDAKNRVEDEMASGIKNIYELTYAYLANPNANPEHIKSFFLDFCEILGAYADEIENSTRGDSKESQTLWRFYRF